MEQGGDVPPPAQGQTEEQRLEQLKKQQEEARQKLEQERLKRQQEIKKLKQALKTGLSGLGKTSDASSMCYNRLSIAQKQIQRLYDCILDFKQIRYLDLNTNTLTDLTLITQFPQLVSINASKNQVNSLAPFKDPNILKNLQFLNLATNKLTMLTPVGLPSLRRLTLTENQIGSAEEWAGHDGVEILELRKNRLKKLAGLKNMRSLQELYVSENLLTDIRGLENLPSLKKLYVRGNKIKKLLKPFPHLPSLTHLNLRQNQIEKIAQLQKIDKHVRSVTLLANPATQELGENARKEIVWAYPHLERINKGVVTLEERIQFEKEWKEKLAERERERLEKEAQEAEARKERQAQQAEAAAAAKAAQQNAPPPAQ